MSRCACPTGPGERPSGCWWRWAARANTADIGLEELGIRLERGLIQVDEHLRTGVGDVYAVGDAIPTAQLAHLGQAEGANAVETALEGPGFSTARWSRPACTRSPRSGGSA